MAITNPFEITYGSRSVGGASNTYLLHGPYVIDKSFETLRLVFDVVIVASSYAALQTLATDLEDDFRKRDQNLTIDLDGSTWSYVFGTDILNTKATLAKTGDPETDLGYSRAYTCVVEGGLPADDQNGLQELEVNVDYEAGRQKIVTMRGTYTALTGTLAAAQYQSDFDTEAATILAAIDGAATFELVDENYTRDRVDHGCNFSRQYVQLLVNQSSGQLDDAQIKDHRLAFTDLSQHPGDSRENIYRLRRVAGNFDCAADIEVTTDLQALFDNKIKAHVIAVFRENFNPQTFAVEDQRVSYDESTKRVSVAIQFLYQKEGGEDIVEISQAVAFREVRTIDYTPVHNGSELDAYADVGWATLERISTRTVIVLGEEAPRRRLGVADVEGAAGILDTVEAGPTVKQTGWNITQNTSQVMDRYVGDPDEEQIRLSVLTETVVERFHSKPKLATPITPRKT